VKAAEPRRPVMRFELNYSVCIARRAGSAMVARRLCLLRTESPDLAFTAIQNTVAV